jgi:uncharacterized protein (TIGR04222 family)
MTGSLVAADAETWGISGPTFLTAFIAVAAGLVVVALLHRRTLYTGADQGVTLAGNLTAEQAAYLQGGEKLAVWAAVGRLRAAEAIAVTARGTLTATGSPPPSPTPLEWAVHQAASGGARPRELPLRPEVASALHRLRDDLERTGLAVPEDARARARVVPAVLLGLLGLGVVRLVTGLANGRPVLLLAAVLAVLTPVTLVLLLRVPRKSPAAKAALDALRARHYHLAPVNQPAYATYGAATIAMGVALYGTATLWQADPAFAEEAEVEQQYAAAGSGYYSAPPDGGASGGDSGGSCGGCGGGCGGCGG